MYMSRVKYENYKLTVLYVKAKIKFEVAEEGDKLTLYVSHLGRFCLPWFKLELLIFTTNIRFHEEQEPFISKELGEKNTVLIFTCSFSK